MPIYLVSLAYWLRSESVSLEDSVELVDKEVRLDMTDWTGETKIYIYSG